MTLIRPGADTLAGYRLVRKLGDGARAEVYLGISTTDNNRTVALKVFRASIPESDIGSEIEVLTAAAGEQVVEVLDVATGPDGRPVLVLERLGNGSLARFLRARGEIDPGEAVTLLAPLAQLVARLHTAGVSHGGISTAKVHINAAGAPVLLGFGRGQQFPAPQTTAGRVGGSEAATDVDALLAVSVQVLSAVRDDSTASASNPLVRWIAERSTGAGDFVDSVASGLAEQLFNWAEPLALDLEREAPVLRRLASLPARPIAMGSPETRSPDQTETDSSHTRRPWRLHPRISEELLGATPLARVGEMLTDSLRSVRTPLWWAAGGIAVALVAAITVLPHLTAAAETETVVAEDADAGPTGEVQPSQSTSPALGDDPVLALPELLAARQECLAGTAIECVALFDSDGSSASASDAAAITASDGGGAAQLVPFLDLAPVLVQRLGDFALLSLGPDSTTASVLMIRTEAGWRIRDVLVAQ
ncbi:MAG: hypothetical protein JWQ43_1818 [Glaciihabitans sp.]|nr:hypothetical protein [Glaciihabitans sp.]